MRVRNAFYGDRFGWVLVPFGYLWSLASVVEELTPDQIKERMVVAFKFICFPRRIPCPDPSQLPQ